MREEDVWGVEMGGCFLYEGGEEGLEGVGCRWEEPERGAWHCGRSLCFASLLGDLECETGEFWLKME